MNIAKFLFFVIVASLNAVLFIACSTTPVSEISIGFAAPVKTGSIVDTALNEASGIAVSKCQPGVLWSHNDSGDDAFIYAFKDTGDKLGTWKIPNAKNYDWEDIAELKDAHGKCWLYLGDIGDNKLRRDEHTIYRVAEPVITADSAASTRREPVIAADAEAIRFKYPDGRHDAETLMVHPRSGDIYIVTKSVSGAAVVFRLRPSATDAYLIAEKVADITVPAIPEGFVTGGDISPDGRRATICDYIAGYEWTLPEGDDNFDDIWKEKPVTINIGSRSIGEAISYSPDGNSLYTTSEGKQQPIFRIDRKVR